MTKQTQTKKLSLSTQTVRALGEQQLVDAAGGYIIRGSAFCTRYFSCTSLLTC